jgi:hypothetical protein
MARRKRAGRPWDGCLEAAREVASVPGRLLRGGVAAVAGSARAFASQEMEDAAELAVGVSPAGFEFHRGRRRYLL